MDKVFPFIIIAPCHKLILCIKFNDEGYNHREQIIMEIMRPQFINLEELNLGILRLLKTGVNNLSSIEQLQFLDMPVLEKLILCKNLINQSSPEQNHPIQRP